jgi:hypothetical protein
VGKSGGWAQDVYPDEAGWMQRELVRSGHLVLGDYPTAAEAKAAIARVLATDS